jgi:hypothetical protein
MKRLMISLLFCSAVIQSGCSSSGGGNSSNADKIVGTWTISKINGTPPALGLDMEFTKDGHVKGMGMEVGTYKVEGDKFIITPAPGKDKKHDPETELIKKLDGTSLILFSEKNKEETEYTRKK